MSNASAFKKTLLSFDRNSMAPAKLQGLSKRVANLDIERIKKASIAAGGLAQWLHAINKLGQVKQDQQHNPEEEKNNAPNKSPVK